MNLKEKSILWITDHTTKDVPAGGAEITDSHIIRAGKEIGYDITVCQSKFLRSDTLKSSDLVVFSNCYDVYKSVRDKIMTTKDYIVYSHDSGRWKSVLKENPLMMKESLINIFLSPLHRDCFKKELYHRKDSLLVCPHLDINFFDRGEDRVNRIMFAGNVHEGKGVLSIIEFAKSNPDINIDFYCHRASSHLKIRLKALKNCHLKGHIPQNKMTDYYNKYKYFIHIPECSEAFGRAVGEAILCGCKVIANNRIGALSYDWDYETLRQNTLYAHYYFWNELQKRLK